MQRLGQHFLLNKNLPRKIVASLEMRPGETVIEIGPGHGELTEPLLAAAARGDAAVVAIEKDHRLASRLVENGTRSPGRLIVVKGDALKELPGAVAALGGGNYVIAGNIPYYITGKLLRILSELGHKPRTSALMIQKEVAERICAAPPDMNRLAASVQFWAEPKIIARVPREDFSPPPEVDSAVILLQTKTDTPAVEPPLYYKIVRGIFAQPRKTILNNASALAGERATKDAIAAAIGRIGVDPEARPQNLGIEQLIALAKLDLWG
jgi:16S rRNA (adenine1518-N6/adenine1519-N6)-dimethyltransferase